MDGDKERTDGAEEEDDDKKQKSAEAGAPSAGRAAVRKEDAVAVKKESSAKEQKPGGGRAPPPVPLRASAQKPKDLPLKEAAPTPSAGRGGEQVEKTKASRPTQRDPAKTVMKPGRSADQSDTRAASKSPCRKRETSPRLTTRKEPSPKRVTAEPKSPLSQRRAEASARHGTCQEAATGRDEGRGARSPRDDKASTPSPGGSPKRLQQTSGSRRTSGAGPDARRSEEQLKVSPQRKARSPTEMKTASPSSRGSPGTKKKITSPRQAETSPKRVPKSKTSSYRQKDRESSESLQEEHVKEAVPKTKCRPPEDVGAPKISEDASDYSKQEAKTTDSGGSSEAGKSEDHSSKPTVRQTMFTAEHRHDQPTPQTNGNGNVPLATENTARPQFEREPQHISETNQQQKDDGNIAKTTETKETPKVNSVPEQSPSFHEQSHPEYGKKTQNMAETSLSEIKPSSDKRPASSCVSGEIGGNASAGETELSTKEALTLRNNAIQTYFSDTQNQSDKLQSVTGASHSDDAKEDVTEEECNTSELLTLERKKKDEKNSTIKGLPEARNANQPENMHKPTVTSGLRRSESEKCPSEKKKRVHSDSSVRNKRDKSAGRIFEETEEKRKTKNKSEKTQEDKFHVDSLHEKLLQGEGTIRKIAKADTMKSDTNLSSPTRKTLRTKIPDGYQELVNKEKVRDEKLQRLENRDVFPDNDAKCFSKLTNKHLKNVNGANITLTSSPQNKYSATDEPRINHLNGQEQPQKFDTHGQAQISRAKEAQVEDESSGCGGLQGRKCPVYFGVKSYLHQFYDSDPSGLQSYEAYLEDEDDFEYMVDPAKRRKSCCSQGLWFRAGIWGGANLLLIGMIAMLVGHLTPPRQVVLETGYDLEVLDRTAIAFNHRLELCRLVGLGVFCCGGMVLLITLLVSTIKHAQREPTIPAAPLVEPFEASPSATKIPITERIKPVQPSIWPQSATVRDGSLVVQMP
ncbi:nucleolar protein dao-5-like [Schistocerca cancellata]|uniref:nucleolar protein dao-5-like n=1 Tax=Schistocerca cancellata TaxID=274614 RepID=UPI00211755DC|nr:nucleolar protein dao-5-like [Schistocerca cancellata]